MDSTDETIVFDEKGVCDYCFNYYNNILPNWHPNEEGEKITSCVASPDDCTAIIKQVKLPTGVNQKIAINALDESLSISTDFGMEDAPSNRPCIRLDFALSIIAERLVADAKHRNQRAKESLNGLITNQFFVLKGDWLWRV